MKPVLFFLCLLLAGFAIVAVADEPTCEAADGCKEDPKCPSRPHIVRCAAEYLDTNKNNKLEREELESAIAKLPWYARGKADGDG